MLQYCEKGIVDKISIKTVVDRWAPIQCRKILIALQKFIEIYLCTPCRFELFPYRLSYSYRRCDAKFLSSVKYIT